MQIIGVIERECARNVTHWIYFLIFVISLFIQHYLKLAFHVISGPLFITKRLIRRCMVWDTETCVDKVKIKIITT